MSPGPLTEEGIKHLRLFLNKGLCYVIDRCAFPLILRIRFGFGDRGIGRSGNL